MFFKALIVSVLLAFSLSGCGLFGDACTDACENTNEQCGSELDCDAECADAEEPTEEEEEILQCIADSESCEAIAECTLGSVELPSEGTTEE